MTGDRMDQGRGRRMERRAAEAADQQQRREHR